MNKIFSDLIYLCRCAVNNVPADLEVVKDMDINMLYKAAKYHTLTAIVAYALESVNIIDLKFKEAKEKAVRKNFFLDVERKKLFKYFEDTGIWYMPLKGIILKDIYPKSGMRQMADNDILFDFNFQTKVRNYFISQQYEVISYNKGNHDVYEKPPVLNFEMHTSLFGKGHNQKWYEYYCDIKKCLLKDKDSMYGYHFSDEDFYVYITTHEYKHHSSSGTGIRSLLDCYVYLKNKSDSMDWEYINKECDKLGIAEFEKQNREIAMKIFGSSENNELSEENLEMLLHYVDSGTYGSLENLVKSQLKKYFEKTGSKSKFRFIMTKIFPNMDYYQKNYPFIFKFKILIPFFVVFRICRSWIKRRPQIIKEFKLIKNTKFDEE